MAVLKILAAQDNNILRQQAVKVAKFDKKTKSLLDDMAETLKSAGGLGLAAPQVGVQQRLFVVRNGADIIRCVNPVIVKAEGTQVSIESCLSLPGVIGKVKRPARVLLRAQDERGRFFEFEALEQLACILSHESDHLDGILFTDKAFLLRRLSTMRPPAARGPEGDGL